MPYTADLRCSYFTSEFNVSWVYEVFTTDFHYDWTFHTNEVEEEYKNKVDRWFQEYVKAKVFNFDPEDKYKHFESIWEMFYENTREWFKDRKYKDITVETSTHCPRCGEDLSEQEEYGDEDLQYKVFKDATNEHCCFYCVSKCHCEEKDCDFNERNYEGEDVCKREYLKILEESKND